MSAHNEPVRDSILFALTAGGHQITADEIRLFSDPGKRTSALSQVCDRLEAVWAQRAAPPDLLQMLHECAEYIAALNGEQDDYCQRARALIARATGEVK